MVISKKSAAGVSLLCSIWSWMRRLTKRVQIEHMPYTDIYTILKHETNIKKTANKQYI